MNNFPVANPSWTNLGRAAFENRETLFQLGSTAARGAKRAYNYISDNSQASKASSSKSPSYIKGSYYPGSSTPRLYKKRMRTRYRKTFRRRKSSKRNFRKRYTFRSKTRSTFRRRRVFRRRGRRSSSFRSSVQKVINQSIPYVKLYETAATAVHYQGGLSNFIGFSVGSRTFDTLPANSWTLYRTSNTGFLRVNAEATPPQTIIYGSLGKIADVARGTEVPTNLFEGNSMYEISRDTSIIRYTNNSVQGARFSLYYCGFRQDSNTTSEINIESMFAAALAEDGLYPSNLEQTARTLSPNITPYMSPYFTSRVKIWKSKSFIVAPGQSGHFSLNSGWGSRKRGSGKVYSGNYLNNSLNSRLKSRHLLIIINGGGLIHRKTPEGVDSTGITQGPNHIDFAVSSIVEFRILSPNVKKSISYSNHLPVVVTNNDYVFNPGNVNNNINPIS